MGQADVSTVQQRGQAKKIDGFAGVCATGGDGTTEREQRSAPGFVEDVDAFGKALNLLSAGRAEQHEHSITGPWV